MRLILGLGVLGGLCLLAAHWQETLRADAHRTRRLEHGIPTGESPEIYGEGGWATLVLGAPSGAERIAPAAPPVAPEPFAPEGDPAPLPPSDPLPVIQADRTHVVAPGDSLGEIAEAHYGTSRSSVVKALARYNGLPSPDQIRLGQSLLLPDLDLLLRD